MFDGGHPSDVNGTLPNSPLEAFDFARNAYRSGDKERALTALQFAAGQGHAGATWMLGRMYAEGDGVSHDDMKAFDYFRELVHRASVGDGDESFEDRGNAPYVSNALVWLGSYYLEGIPGTAIKPSPQVAIRLFTDAASNYGDPNAQYNLARIYLDGNGVKRDAAQAVRWLNLAAQKNHGPSRALLGHMMFKGEVVKRQPARGLMLMMLARQSAEQSGSSDARWMIDLHEKALQEASEEERRSATSFLDGWLKARSN
ncbi:tetratricopeptide repeat protein [Terrihabitans sp. B22-R8]|uniref:tetratricopeptide repeat protein n=1 Tax=Terrihabitans sp. B22-R8 TaxID=3425128 RepID=UPI00403CB246